MRLTTIDVILSAAKASPSAAKATLQHIATLSRSSCMYVSAIDHTLLAETPQGYHVQITARSDRDLTPDNIMAKVASASGANYDGVSSAPTPAQAPRLPPVASKPAFLPTRSSGPSTMNGTTISRDTRSSAQKEDADGWGADAPQVSRSQLEKVESAYKPTRVNMAELTRGSNDSLRTSDAKQSSPGINPDVVSGAYKPIAKVDIEAIRREAQSTGQPRDDRPTIVKGAYEPVGKIDIAAIRARAQGNVASQANDSPDRSMPEASNNDSIARDSSTIHNAERMTSMPKAKVASRFGSQASVFSGTKAPAPGISDFGKPVASNVPVGTASRTFADQGGKTPAQIWAEKKARQGGSATAPEGSAPRIRPQQSGSWQSGYAGKKWNAVQTTKTGGSNVSANDPDPSQNDDDEGQPAAPTMAQAGLHDGRQEHDIDQQLEHQAPPPPVPGNRPGIQSRSIPSVPSSAPQVPAEEHVDLPPPPVQPRTPSPEPSHSPVRIAMPVSRTAAPQEIVVDEPKAIPVSLVKQAAEDMSTDKSDTHLEEEDDAARGAAVATANAGFGENATQPDARTSVGGKRALIQYDYEKAEENEIELKEGEYVTNIEMVDDDWWLGQNSAGQRDLFPSNYVELEQEDAAVTEPHASSQAESAPHEEQADAASSHEGATATAQYDYEAAEDNELSFPDGATITNVVSLTCPTLTRQKLTCIRLSRMTTGGWASIMDQRDFSHPIMSRSIHELQCTGTIIYESRYCIQCIGIAMQIKTAIWACVSWFIHHASCCRHVSMHSVADGESKC